MLQPGPGYSNDRNLRTRISLTLTELTICLRRDLRRILEPNLRDRRAFVSYVSCKSRPHLASCSNVCSQSQRSCFLPLQSFNQSQHLLPLLLVTCEALNRFVWTANRLDRLHGCWLADRPGYSQQALQDVLKVCFITVNTSRFLPNIRCNSQQYQTPSICSLSTLPTSVYL